MIRFAAFPMTVVVSMRRRADITGTTSRVPVRRQRLIFHNWPIGQRQGTNQKKNREKTEDLTHGGR